MRKPLMIFILLMTALASVTLLNAGNKPLVPEDKGQATKETIDIS